MLIDILLCVYYPYHAKHEMEPVDTGLQHGVFPAGFPKGLLVTYAQGPKRILMRKYEKHLKHWLVVWNIIGNFIIPTDELHHFSEGWLNHQLEHMNIDPRNGLDMSFSSH